MIKQCFAVDGAGPGRRFFEIGRRLARGGHRVTVITGNSRLGLSLDRKKIGLLQKKGMALIVFNIDHPLQEAGRKRGSARSFARRALLQGRRLPPADLVLASTPPAAVYRPAYALSCFYKAPLIMEIGDEAGIRRSGDENILKKLFTSSLRRAARKGFERAHSIIAISPGVAQLAEEFAPPGKTVHLLPDDLGDEALFQRFSDILKAAGEEI